MISQAKCKLGIRPTTPHFWKRVKVGKTKEIYEMLIPKIGLNISM
jgi:hypothetical protein